MSAAILSLTDISLTFGGDPLFTDATLDVRPGARIALVGRNGSGKSTLLKIAADLVTADAGERFVQPGTAVRYLPQEPEFGAFETAHDYVSAALSDERDGHIAQQMLAEFGVDADAQLEKLSGGEAKRIAIAAAFAARPDVILMDEPTNHLDIAAIAQLEEKIAKSNAAFIIISHDRRFLETLTTSTIWIDRGATHHLSRGFANFEEWRDKKLEEEKTAQHKLGRKIAAEEDWVRYGVTARRKRNVRRMAELKTMRKALREAPRATGSVSFAATDAERSSRRMIVAENIAKRFDGRAIVEDFSVEICRGDKIGVVAPNGAGKTTIMNMLIGALAPDAGIITKSDTLALVTLDQQRARLKPDQRLADAITDGRGDWVTIDGVKKHAATYLQDFLFAPEQWRAPVSSLSGGERGRLALAAALAYPSNILALDEPTNDLDLETLDLLQDFLSDYKGAVLLISHDRNFLDNIVTSIITTDPDAVGAWRRYPGGYDDMVAQRGRAPGAKAAREKRASKDKRISSQKITTQKTGAHKTGAPKTTLTKLSFKEKHALKTLPVQIAALETEIAALNASLADTTLFERNAEEFSKKARRLDEAKEALEKAEEAWLEITIKQESLKS